MYKVLYHEYESLEARVLKNASKSVYLHLYYPKNLFTIFVYRWAEAAWEKSKPVY